MPMLFLFLIGNLPPLHYTYTGEGVKYEKRMSERGFGTVYATFTRSIKDLKRPKKKGFLPG